MPSVPGILMSRSTTSKSAFCSWRSASAAPAATATRSPSFRNQLASESRTENSSSTIRIDPRRPGGALGDGAESAVIEWSYDDADIYAIASRLDGDMEALLAWWRDVGRLLSR